MERPEWWDWDLAFDSHVEARMEERDVSDIDLRTMIEDATDFSPNRRIGRWRISTRLRGQPWVIVVEPDLDGQITHVITVFRQD